jgi:hypothetical protein
MADALPLITSWIDRTAAGRANATQCLGRDSKSYSLICISEKQKYFCKGGLDRPVTNQVN